MNLHRCGHEITEEECGHAELLDKIRLWSEAYPLSVFPEPSPGEHGSVDTCSARMGRHVIGRLMELIPARGTTEEP